VTSKLVASLIATAILFVLIGLFFFVNQREALLLDGKAQISSLQYPVNIHFDQLAVPYIEARSEKDLTIAQGFVTASQRLFQMDMLRHIAKGEMASIFGNSCLVNDKLARIIGFKRITEAEYLILLPETKNWLKAYSQGVNSYISRGKLPLEFILLGYEPQPWQPEDSLAILKYLQYASDECWQLNVLQNAIAERGGIDLAKKLFGPAFKLSSLSTTSAIVPLQSFAPAAHLAWGSNGWVVSKEMSQSHGSLLACSKDTIFSLPSLFFLSSLRAPFIHVAGITIPGVPGILIGRNDYFGWAAINLKTRSQELNIEQFSEKIPNQYSNKQGVFQAKELHEEIACRFAPTRMEKIVITKDGPLLTKNGQAGVAINWYGSNPANNIIDSIRPLNKTKSWSDFSTSLEKYKGSPQAFLFADTAGNIGQYLAAYNKHAGHLLLAQETDASNENLPGLPQFSVASEGQIYPAIGNCPSLLSSGTTWAATRAKQILTNNQANKAKLNLENMIAMQADTKASLNESVTKTIKNALIKTKNTDQYQSNALTLLDKWDGQLKSNSVCAGIYESFLASFSKKILQGQIGEQLSIDYINKWPYWTKFAANILDKQETSLLPATQGDFSIFSLNCFAQTLKDLRLKLDIASISRSMNKMQWQNLHKIDFHNNLARFFPISILKALGPVFPNQIGIGADQDSLNACNYQINKESPFYISNSGPTARLVVDMADNDKFYHSLIFGQSGHLFSRDRIDSALLKSWQDLEFHAIAFSPRQLASIKRHTLSLGNLVE
jgi:penicillin amidase